MKQTTAVSIFLLYINDILLPRSSWAAALACMAQQLLPSGPKRSPSKKQLLMREQKRGARVGRSLSRGSGEEWLAEERASERTPSAPLATGPFKAHS